MSIEVYSEKWNRWSQELPQLRYRNLSWAVGVIAGMSALAATSQHFRRFSLITAATSAIYGIYLHFYVRNIVITRLERYKTAEQAIFDPQTGLMRMGLTRARGQCRDFEEADMHRWLKSDFSKRPARQIPEFHEKDLKTSLFLTDELRSALVDCLKIIIRDAAHFYSFTAAIIDLTRHYDASLDDVNKNRMIELFLDQPYPRMVQYHQEGEIIGITLEKQHVRLNADFKANPFSAFEKHGIEPVDQGIVAVSEVDKKALRHQAIFDSKTGLMRMGMTTARQKYGSDFEDADMHRWLESDFHKRPPRRIPTFHGTDLNNHGLLTDKLRKDLRGNFFNDHRTCHDSAETVLSRWEETLKGQRLDDETIYLYVAARMAISRGKFEILEKRGQLTLEVWDLLDEFSQLKLMELFASFVERHELTPIALFINHFPDLLTMEFLVTPKEGENMRPSHLSGLSWNRPQLFKYCLHVAVKKATDYASARGEFLGLFTHFYDTLDRQCEYRMYQLFLEQPYPLMIQYAQDCQVIGITSQVILDRLKADFKTDRSAAWDKHGKELLEKAGSLTDPATTLQTLDPFGFFPAEFKQMITNTSATLQKEIAQSQERIEFFYNDKCAQAEARYRLAKITTDLDAPPENRAEFVARAQQIRDEEKNQAQLKMAEEKQACINENIAPSHEKIRRMMIHYFLQDNEG